MAELTEQQKQTYLANGGNVCPYCESADICGGAIDISGREAWQEVSCNECHATWNDVYNLASIEEVEAGERSDANGNA
jgi:hypothetical protein